MATRPGFPPSTGQPPAKGGKAARLWDATRTGLCAGLFLALLLVPVEVFLIAAWWWGDVIAPDGLAQTRMFDFLAEIYRALRSLTGLSWLPPSLASVYGPDWWDSLLLARDLALVTLPLGAIAGVLAAWAAALATRAPTAGRIVGLLAGFGLVSEIIGWIASVQLPVRYSLHSALALALRNFVWDGVLVSCLSLALAASLAFAGCRWLRVETAGLPVGRRRAGLFLLAAITWVVCAAAAEVPTGHASLPPAQGQTRPLDPNVPRPNVLLISIDSLRADRLGCYGNFRDTSPRIDALARAGVLFTNGWSTTSWTLPAHVSMLSGRSLLGHSVQGARRIPASVPMLAEIMRGHGYRTAAFVSAPWLSSRFGFDRGFDLYDDFSVPFAPDRESRMRAQATLSAPLLAPAIEKWLRGSAKPPFFLFLHYFDVHYDYQPPPPYDTMFDPDYRGSITGRRFHADPRIRAGMDKRDLDHLLALYDGEIRFTDGYIGQVLDTMRELGLLQNTFVILTADHGDEFFEHGGKGHHRTLYEEVLHVPLIMSWPGHLPQGVKVADPASLVDLAPTILALIGAPPPRGMEGASLLPVATAQGSMPPRSLVSELYLKQNLNLQVAVRQGERKLIQSLNFPRREVYDLASDPGESRPRAGAEAAPLARELGRWLRSTWREQEELGSDTGKVALDRGRIEALRALGYVE